MDTKKRISDFITKDSMMDYIKKTYKNNPEKLKEEQAWFYEKAFAPVSVNMNSVIVEFLNRYNPTIVIKKPYSTASTETKPEESTENTKE